MLVPLASNTRLKRALLTCTLDNVSRDLMRGLIAELQVAQTFFSSLTLQGGIAKPDQPTTNKMPFLLVHEVWAALASKSSNFAAQCCTLPSLPALEEEIAGLCCPGGAKRQTVILVGIHGDGVHYKTRKSILEFLSNVLHDASSERIRFCTIGRCGCHGRHSRNVIIVFLKSSLECLFSGTWPDRLHGGAAWALEDRERQDHHGDSDVRGLLAQANGQWARYKEVFVFCPWVSDQMFFGFAEPTSPTCHTAAVSSNAHWRTSRSSAAALFKKQRSNGIRPSPMFQCSDFSSGMVRWTLSIDWTSL